MAVIKTGNTHYLMEDLYETFLETVGLEGYDDFIGRGIAKDALALADRLQEAADGANDEGTLSWKTTQGATSVTHTETLKNHLWEDEDAGWVENGSTKLTFTGSNLDGEAAKVTKFDYNASGKMKKDAPGFIGSESFTERYSAAIDFSPNSQQITIKNFSGSASDKESGSGFKGFDWGGDTYSGSSSSSVTFKGSSTFNVAVGVVDWHYDAELDRWVEEYGRTAELASTTIQSLSAKRSFSEESDGQAGYSAWSGKESWEFALATSGDGLTFTLGEDGQLTVAGKLTGLTYSEKLTETVDGKSHKSEDYFKYSDAAGSLDASKLAFVAEPKQPDLTFPTYPNIYDFNGDQAGWDAALDAYNQEKDAYDEAWDAYDEAWDAWYNYDPVNFREELLKGNDTITATDTDGSDLRGGAGNDRITGNIGDDVLEGEEGDDTLIGGKGNDELYGGAGKDTLDGGAGNDTLGGGADNDILKGGAGHDELYGHSGNDTLDGGAGNDGLFGGTGNDTLIGGAGNDFLDGEEGDDTLDGGAGNDQLEGGEGNDTLKGGAGHDVLYGGEGDDTLDGGAGNDMLIGAEGKDVMTGGTGRDGFYFFAGDSGDEALALSTLDVIKDFNVKQDSIHFEFEFDEAYVLTKDDTSSLGLRDSYEALLAAANASAKQVVVGYDNANAYVFADSDEDGEMDLAIQLVGVKGDASVKAIQFEAIEMYV